VKRKPDKSNERIDGARKASGPGTVDGILWKGRRKNL
jgi:hypothetical protein